MCPVCPCPSLFLCVSVCLFLRVGASRRCSQCRTFSYQTPSPTKRVHAAITPSKRAITLRCSMSTVPLRLSYTHRCRQSMSTLPLRLAPTANGIAPSVVEPTIGQDIDASPCACRHLTESDGRLSVAGRDAMQAAKRHSQWSDARQVNHRSIKSACETRKQVKAPSLASILAALTACPPVHAIAMHTQVLHMLQSATSDQTQMPLQRSMRLCASSVCSMREHQL